MVTSCRQHKLQWHEGKRSLHQHKPNCVQTDMLAACMRCFSCRVQLQICKHLVRPTYITQPVFARAVIMHVAIQRYHCLLHCQGTYNMQHCLMHFAMPYPATTKSICALHAVLCDVKHPKCPRTSTPRNRPRKHSKCLCTRTRRLLDTLRSFGALQCV